MIKIHTCVDIGGATSAWPVCLCERKYGRFVCFYSHVRLHEQHVIELSCSWSRVCRQHHILSCSLWELWCCFWGVAWGLREGRGNHPCPLAYLHVAGQRHAWLNTWLTRCRYKKKDMQPSGNSRHGSLSRTSKTGNQSDDSDDLQSETLQVDPHILAAIKQAVREVVNTKLSKIDEALQ